MSRGYPLPADQIDRARALRGWTVTEMAVKADISAATASRVLAGRRASMATLQRLAIAFVTHPPRADLQALLNGDLDRGSQPSSEESAA